MSTVTNPIVILLWLAYVGIWIFSSGLLSDTWRWIQALPTVWEVIVWIVFLPWVVSLWIWHSSWPLWARILVIIVIAIATIGGSTSGARHERERRRAKTAAGRPPEPPAPPSAGA